MGENGWLVNRGIPDSDPRSLFSFPPNSTICPTDGSPCLPPHHLIPGSSHASAFHSDPEHMTPAASHAAAAPSAAPKAARGKLHDTSSGHRLWSKMLTPGAHWDDKVRIRRESQSRF